MAEKKKKRSDGSGGKTMPTVADCPTGSKMCPKNHSGGSAARERVTGKKEKE